MRNIPLLLCLLSGWLPLSAQIGDGWVEAGNAAYNSSLVSVEFLSGDVGFAAGAGGATWPLTFNLFTALGDPINWTVSAPGAGGCVCGAAGRKVGFTYEALTEN
jgi:hypothetical protein